MTTALNFIRRLDFSMERMVFVIRMLIYELDNGDLFEKYDLKNTKICGYGVGLP
ncbi:MAG: hypothetical protein JKY52_14880 [Flavobacteriales bacterium]|nr:hypothetical protein [Flavobacteriales bacterium]